MLFNVFLSITLIAIYDCRNVTIQNNCDYTVWFEIAYDDSGLPDPDVFEILSEAMIHPLVLITLPFNNDHLHDERHLHLAPRTSGTYTVTDNVQQEIIYPMIGCDTNGDQCESGGIDIDSIVDSSTSITLYFASSTSSTSRDTYIVSFTVGYNIPVQILSIGDNDCDNITCNVTLADCPIDENYKIGDLRVLKDNRTVMCSSACRKRPMRTSGSFGEIRFCTEEKFPELKYVAMVKDKCPGSKKIGAIADTMAVVQHCQTGNSYELVTCP